MYLFTEWCLFLSRMGLLTLLWCRLKYFYCWGNFADEGIFQLSKQRLQWFLNLIKISSHDTSALSIYFLLSNFKTCGSYFSVFITNAENLSSLWAASTYLKATTYWNNILLYLIFFRGNKSFWGLTQGKILKINFVWFATG